MKVLVDTCIWSLALRRKNHSATRIEIIELHELIKEVRVQLIGPVRQEILSGIKSKQQFSKLKRYYPLSLIYHFLQKIMNWLRNILIHSEVKGFRAQILIFLFAPFQAKKISPSSQRIRTSDIFKSIFQLPYTHQGLLPVRPQLILLYQK